VGPNRAGSWLAAGLAVAAFGLVVNLAPDTQVAVVVDDLGSTAGAALAAFACLQVARTATGVAADRRGRRGWRLIGLACASWAAGNAVWALYELGLGWEAPFPSPADIGYLGFVPLAVAGVALLGPTLSTGSTLTRTMDAVLVTVSLGGAGWILVLAPVAAGTEASFERALALAYPVGDLLMLALILSVISLRRDRLSALGLLLTGLTLITLADVSFAYMTATAQYASGGLTAWAWFSGFVVIALAAWTRRAEPAFHRQLDPAEARRNWPEELIALLPALTVGALAVSDWIADDALSTGTFCLILIVGVLNAVRHQVVGRQTRQLNRVLARQVERAQAERERTRQVIDEARHPYLELDREGRILVWNRPATATFGWSGLDVVGRPVTELLAPEDREMAARRSAEFTETGDPTVWDDDTRLHCLRPDGSRVIVELAVWHTGEGDGFRVHAFLWDISERVAGQELLEASEQRWRALVRHSSDITLVLDGDGRLVHEMPTVHDLLGYREGENHGRHFADLIHPQDFARVAPRFARLLAEPGRQERSRVRIHRADGSWVPVEAIATNLLDVASIRGVVCNLRDIREQVAAEDELRRQARQDPLTGLPNRSLLSAALTELCDSQEEGRSALLLMDLDGFKDINDGLGHDIGDRLLIEIGQRLARVTRAEDVVARLGGDEFAVLLTRLPEFGYAVRIAEELGAVIQEPVHLCDVTLEVGVSIGVAGCRSGDDPQSVLQRADVAMYRAKRQRSGVAVYGSDDDEERRKSVRVATDLRQSIDRGDLMVHYQPKIELGTGMVDSVEALVRWAHPVRGILAPDAFIALAERTGLIRDLTTWVLATALRQCATWASEGMDLPVAVNISPRVLGHAGFVTTVREALQASGLPASRLTLEITESSFPENTRLLSATLSQLRDLGVRLSVDDFGTGWSTLTKLKELPVQELKIDRSFVSTMAEDDTDRSIVRSILDLAHSLGLTVVAEGVETEEVADLLHDLGCPLVQGYLFSRPIPGQELTGWVLQQQLKTRGHHPSRPTDAEDTRHH
jgi:diguanylate cyclase (GGDEF)-like protein/PAS domain S-box-containing protein